VLSGLLTSISAQIKPVDSQPGDTAATSQNPSSDSQGQAVPTLDAGQSHGLVHIVPFGQVGKTVKNGFAPAEAHLTYWGGPVISNIHAVAVFWGPNVNTAITGTPGIAQFFTDITTSRHYDLLSEYSTVGVTGAGAPATSSNQAIGHGFFDGKFTITPSICPGPTACTVSDAQVAAELVRQITAGHLPQPVTDTQGNVNSFYMIYFPPGITITLDPVTRSCVQFCAYHSNTPANLTPKLVPYGVEPDFAPPSACANGCGGNPSLFDNVTEVTSHEMSEAVTDAQVGSATVFGPPLAWYDPDPAANPLAEIGDICVGQGAVVPAGNSTYVVQQEFSNLQNDCVSAPPVFNMTTPSAGVGPSQSFNVTLTIQSSVAPFTLTGYTGTVHFTNPDTQAILPADYTFLPSDAGSHQFAFTLKTLGDQTISVVDTHSSGFTGSATVNVNTTPDLTISNNHTGNFSVGQTGATYTIAVSNVGRGPTSGTVSVVDTLPSGLTATAIGGTGWTCTVGTLTCNRADAVAAGSSYPAITLTVNVAANAPSFVTNVAIVSGGGETNATNDTASDPTTVLAPDLAVGMGHFGPINGNFFQGETGATYTITVQNPGNLATSGTVTMVDTPPATGLNPTAISGTGWSCTLATLTCTRSDVLAAFSSYPQITVTVDVPIGAPASVINTATVSGGGEVNTANDLTQDVTVILPPPTPDLTVGMFHSQNFVQGQTGLYQIAVTNVGTKITSGTVTLTDTLPVGLTATAASGTGWTCTLGTAVTCTRSDALDFNFSYPTIILNVNIAADAPASVTNVATVSGSGDTNNANNSFSDLTQIATPLVDLTPNVSGTGFVSQGQTNVNFPVFINNTGNIASSGAITVIVNLSTGLTAAAISGDGWTCTLNNLTCTRSDALIAGGFSSPINLTVNVANNAPASGKVSATVSGGSDGSSANNTGANFVIIQPMVSITPLVSATTVTAGTPAQFSLIVNPLPTAGGPATLSCSGLPSASSCTFTPSSVPTNVGGAFVSLVISTTGRSAAAILPTGPGDRTPLVFLLMFGLAGLVSIALKYRLWPTPQRKLVLAVTGMLLLLVMISGCGGGSGATPQVVTQQGTPSGTYPITVTAATPNESVSTVMTLTVR